MTKTETIESHRESFDSLESESHRTLAKNSPRKWKNLQKKTDLIKSCLLCDNQIQVKYIPPKKQYSRKNNWGYWTGKAVFNNKYACNSCLLKLYKGNINDWIENETRVDVFYNYVKRRQF